MHQDVLAMQSSKSAVYQLFIPRLLFASEFEVSFVRELYPRTEPKIGPGAYLTLNDIPRNTLPGPPQISQQSDFSSICTSRLAVFRFIYTPHHANLLTG